jgi:hypothetical protein
MSFYTSRLLLIYLSLSLLSLFRGIGVKYLHERDDPNTKQQYAQVKDKGIVVALIINLPSSDQLCNNGRSKIYRFLSLLGLSMRYTSSRVNYVAFSQAHREGSSDAFMTEHSACYLKHFKNPHDVEVIELSKLRNKNIDVLIVSQPFMNSLLESFQLRGKINVLAVSDIYPYYNISLASETLHYLSDYDLVFTPTGEDSEVYPSLLRHAVISTSLTNLPMLPTIHNVAFPVSDRAAEFANDEKQPSSRDIAAFVGSLARGMSQEVVVSQALQQYIALKRKLFPLYDKTMKSEECDGPLAGKLHLIAYRSKDELSVQSIAEQMHIPACQYDIVDRYDDESLYQVLRSSAVLWHLEDVFQPSLMTTSCLYTMPGSKMQCDMIHYYRAIDVNRELIQYALALNCIPIAFHSSADSFSRDVWSQKLQLYHHQNGFVAQSYEDLVSYSHLLVSPPYKQIEKFQTAARNIVSEHLTSEYTCKFLAEMMVLGVVDNSYRRFVNTTIHDLRKQPLNPAMINTSIAGYVAMIVEPRINFAVEYSVRNVMSHLGSCWGLRIFYSSGISGNIEYLQKVLSDIVNIDYQPIPVAVVSGDSYNAFMKSYNLWSNLARVAKRVLIFQTDSLLIRPDIDRFLMYDYIGAPWHMVDRTSSFSWLKRMQKYGYLKAGVGNGGLSLRNPGLMANISMLHGKGSGSLNEDVFFASHVEKLAAANQASFPTRAIAYDFALETPCDDIRKLDLHLPESLPFAIHSAWGYVDADQATLLFNASLRTN